MPRYLLVATAAVTLTAIVTLRTRCLLVTVHGASMAPVYEEGDLLLARRVPRSRNWRAGEDLVFARSSAVLLPPGDPDCLVKRVRARPGDPLPERTREVVSPGWLVLQGLNDGGAPSPFYYSVPVSSVLGKVVTRLRRGRP